MAPWSARASMEAKRKVSALRSASACRLDFGDVDFVVNELVSEPAELGKIKDSLQHVDGILVIHLSMGISDSLKAILAANQPTVLFAAPYSGHEWSGFGALQRIGYDRYMALECRIPADPERDALAPPRSARRARRAGARPSGPFRRPAGRRGEIAADNETK